MSELTTHLREEDIVPYLDGRLGPAERERLDAHLSACVPCREHVGELRAVMEELDAWTPADPAGSFDAAVRQKLTLDDRISAGTWAWLWRPGWGVALLAAVFAVGGAGIWFSTPQGPGPSEGFVAAAEEVDAVFDAALESGKGLEAVDPAPWLVDYELIQEFDTLFDDSANGSSHL